MVQVEIDVVDDGKQVQKWLRLLLPGMPLSGIHKFIRTGRIKVNGKRAKRDTLVHQGDLVNLYMTQEDFDASSKSRRQKFAGVDRSIDVQYETEEMLVVNKPLGVLVHAADGDYASTLQAQVEAYVYRSTETKTGQAFTPAPVHRLDRNTTGLVMFAKTSRAARDLGFAFQAGEIRKTYLALVTGEVRAPGTITASLARDNDVVTRVTDEGGKASATAYWPIASSGGTTLVRIQLETGRTHQIRAHMAHVKHPLVGDVKYGGRRADQPFYLHAARLTRDGVFDVYLGLPDRFATKLKQLKYSIPDVTKLLNDR